MNAVHRRQIERAFSGASDYDRHARIQRVVARRLAARIAALPLPASPRVLEIGCGTGFLTEALIEQGLGGEWLITDISPEMVGRCQARIGEAPARRFAVLDGEYGQPAGDAFDLICSSLVTQWFDDHAAAVARILQWLAPGGHHIFATLGAGSFAEWRAAHEAEGLTPGTPRFPEVSELSAQGETPVIEQLIEKHDSAVDFMRSLKAIGAGTAKRRHRPLSPPELRRVMRHFEEAGCTVSYEVATCHHRKP